MDHPIIVPTIRPIVVRGVAPEYIVVRRAMRLDENPIGNNIRQALRSLFFDTTSNVSDRDSVMTGTDEETVEEEEEAMTEETIYRTCVEKLKEIGPNGIRMGSPTDNLMLAWRDPSISVNRYTGRTFGQNSTRSQEGLIVKKWYNGFYGISYVCRQPGCFSYVGTYSDEVEPKCFKHKGNEGYAIQEFGVEENDILTAVDFTYCHYSYRTGFRDLDYKRRVRSNTSLKSQPGFLILRKYDTDDPNEADRVLAVWQTAAMLKALINPNFSFKTGFVSLAIGCEHELATELKHRGVVLNVTGKLKDWNEADKIPYPFGEEPGLNVEPNTLLSKNNGVVYMAFDENIMYPGQSTRTDMNNTNSAVHSPAKRTIDTLSAYKDTGNRVLKTIAIACAKKDEVHRIESHVHVAVFLLYLFRMRNKYNRINTHTHPYLLNKVTQNKYFDAQSWNRITAYLLKKFGFRLDGSST